MSDKTLLSDQIEVTISGFFTTHHYLQAEEGTLGEFTFPAFGQGAVYRAADGRELQMKKTHWLKSTHELVEGEAVRGSADRRGAFRRDMVIQFEGLEYTLVPEGILKQGWFLVDAWGNRLLEFRPRGILRQGAYITICNAVDVDLLAFAYYLVYVRQQEDAAAGAAAAS